MSNDSNVDQAASALQSLMNKKKTGPRVNEDAPSKASFNLGTMRNTAALKDKAKLTKEIESSASRYGELLELDPNDIVVSSQVRKHFSEEPVDDLANSILAMGQLQPGVVEELPDGRLGLVIGERRLRAIKKLIEQGVDIKYVARKLSVPKLIAQLTENIQRENLSPLEEASAFATLKNIDPATGEVRAKPLSMIDLAKIVHKTRQFVSDRLSLLEYHPDVGQLVENKGIKDNLFLKALNSIFELNEDFGKQLLAGIYADKTLTRAMAIYIRKVLSGNEEALQGQPADDELLSLFSKMLTSDTELVRQLILVKNDNPQAYEEVIQTALAEERFDYPLMQSTIESVASESAINESAKGKPSSTNTNHSQMRRIVVRSQAGIEAVLQLDKVDKDAEYVWIRHTDNQQLHRIHVSELSIIAMS